MAWKMSKGTADSNEQREAQIKALLRELEFYVNRDKPDRVKAINAELRRLGHEAATPAARAQKRPSARRAQKR